MQSYKKGCIPLYKFKKLLDKHRLEEHEGESSKKEYREEEEKTLDSTRGETAERQEELNTVEIDGEMFVVQETGGSISLLPLVQTEHSLQNPAS